MVCNYSRSWLLHWVLAVIFSLCNFLFNDSHAELLVTCSTHLKGRTVCKLFKLALDPVKNLHSVNDATDMLSWAACYANQTWAGPQDLSQTWAPVAIFLLWSLSFLSCTCVLDKYHIFLLFVDIAYLPAGCCMTDMEALHRQLLGLYSLITCPTCILRATSMLMKYT